MNPNSYFPKTKLEDYLKYRSEIAAQTNLATIRFEVYPDKTDTIYNEFNNKIDQIYSRYANAIHLDDVYAFNNLIDLESFLKEDLELSEHEIREAINHEKENLNKMAKSGYLPKGFGCILLKDKNNKPTYAIQTHIDAKIIPYTDWINMISTEKNLEYK